MKVSERNDRPVDEAPDRKDGFVQPPVFQRTFQHSRVVLSIAVLLGSLVAFALLLIGGAVISDGELFGIAVVFGVFGLAVLAVSVKGAWALVGGPKVHVLCLEPDGVVWGVQGAECRLELSEIASIRYTIDTDSDGAGDLSLVFKTHDGERLSVNYVSDLVPRKSRPKLLAYIRATYPETPLLISQ